jgi:hypothetical protein
MITDVNAQPDGKLKKKKKIPPNFKAKEKKTAPP